METRNKEYLKNEEISKVLDEKGSGECTLDSKMQGSRPSTIWSSTTSSNFSLTNSIHKLHTLTHCSSSRTALFPSQRASGNIIRQRPHWHSAEGVKEYQQFGEKLHCTKTPRMPLLADPLTSWSWCKVPSPSGLTPNVPMLPYPPPYL